MWYSLSDTMENLTNIYIFLLIQLQDTYEYKWHDMGPLNWRSQGSVQ